MSLRLLNKWRSSNTLGTSATLGKSNPVVTYSSDPVKALRIRVATLLMENDLNLLAALCQSTFVGDTAAAVANTIISLLKQMKDGVPDNFVRRILKTKIFIYMSKGRKLADIIRDNSMSTMILTAYAKMVGTQFLNETLYEPLKEIITYIGDSSGNVTKEEESDAENAEDESMKQLLKASSCLLNAILSNKDKIPHQFKQICRFVKLEVDQVIRSPPPRRSSISSHDNSPRSSIGSRKRFSFVGSTFSGERIDEEQNDKIVSIGSSEDRIVQITVESTASVITSVDSSCEKIGNERKKLDSDPDEVARTSNELKPHPLSKVTNLQGFSSNSIGFNESILSMVENNSMSLPDRVVGTLIFLRFFVPAIAAPENHDMLQGKVNNRIRKGLINVGKVLNGFSSEADFKQKDPNWGQVNDFVLKHKHEVKSFIDSITSDESLDRSILSKKTLTENVSLKDILSEDKDVLQKAQKDDYLESTKTTETVKELEVDEHLIVYLSRSLARIEKDLDHLVKLLSATEVEGVLESFAELKKELELYNHLSIQQAKPVTLLGKLGRKFGSLRISKSVSALKESSAKSSDDLSDAKSKTPDMLRKEKPSLKPTTSNASISSEKYKRKSSKPLSFAFDR